MRRAVLFGATLAMLASTACAYEEPEYQVLETRNGYELRLYAPYLVAETTVPGNLDDSGSQAFRILAGYIFGDNHARRDDPTQPLEPVKMNMTVPVTAEASTLDAEQHVYQFVMERRYSLENLPVPSDDRVRIRQLPERTVAVLRYSGRSTASNFASARDRLRGYLQRDGLKGVSRPRAAYYNSPFTPPFMRRNEVLIEVETPSGSTP